MVKRVWLWLPPIAYMAIIFYLSSQSHPLPQLTEHVWDKLLHTIEYAGLAVLIGRGLVGEQIDGTTAMLLAAALASLYGASDEFHQLFTPGRDSSVFDWLADTIGSGIGAVAYGSLVRAFVPSRRVARSPGTD